MSIAASPTHCFQLGFLPIFLTSLVNDLGNNFLTMLCLKTEFLLTAIYNVLPLTLPSPPSALFRVVTSLSPLFPFTELNNLLKVFPGRTSKTMWMMTWNVGKLMEFMECMMINNHSMIIKDNKMRSSARADAIYYMRSLFHTHSQNSLSFKNASSNRNSSTISPNLSDCYSMNQTRGGK